ncbi:MAG TPA: 4Fe-4S binding protein [Anaeromyxobacteraceae bacterium]|nr:4Fe-4S binding protein [Anaeromyxobacteraceae bacterium]
MVRDIVEIDEAKCDGCGECIPACAEGALFLEHGKLRLRADALCDGLGACLGACSKGALRVVRREAAGFDEDRAFSHAPWPRLKVAPLRPEVVDPGPGSRAPALRPATRPRLTVVTEEPKPFSSGGASRLGQWPVKIALVPEVALYLRGADLLVAADCVPFAYARFHDDFLDGRRVLAGCPKLDDLKAYAEKLEALFRQAEPRSVTVVKMEVPCCHALASATAHALERSGSSAPLELVTIGLEGSVLDRRELLPS